MWNVFPGRKVVCVLGPEIWRSGTDAGSAYWRSVCPHLPELDKVYTVRSVKPDAVMPNVIGLRLEEIVNPAAVFRVKAGTTPDCYIIDEPQFDVNGFRPLWEGETDISELTKLTKWVSAGGRLVACD